MMWVRQYRHFLSDNFCIPCIHELLTGWSPDQPTHGLPTIRHRCTVGVLAGTHRCDDSSKQDDESPKRQPCSAALHWGSAALHWAETGLHWLLTWRVHLQHYQTWPMLCAHLTTQKKPNQIETWLAWLENSIDRDAPFSHANTLLHSQSYCWSVLSIFVSFTPSWLGTSLPLRTVKFTCVLIRIISYRLTYITVLMVEWHARPLRFFCIWIMELLGLSVAMLWASQLPWTTPDCCHHWATWRCHDWSTLLWLLPLFTLWQLGSTLTIQLVIHEASRLKSSFCNKTCWTIFRCSESAALVPKSQAPRTTDCAATKTMRRRWGSLRSPGRRRTLWLLSVTERKRTGTWSARRVALCVAYRGRHLITGAQLAASLGQAADASDSVAVLARKKELVADLKLTTIIRGESIMNVLLCPVFLCARVVHWLPQHFDGYTGMLLGAMLAASVPVAVLAAMKELGSDSRLTTIISRAHIYKAVFNNEPFPTWSAVKFTLENTFGAEALGLLILKLCRKEMPVVVAVNMAVSWFCFYKATVVGTPGILSLTPLSLGLRLFSRVTVRELNVYIANTSTLLLQGIIKMIDMLSSDVSSKDFWDLFYIYTVSLVARAITVVLFLTGTPFPSLRTLRGSTAKWRRILCTSRRKTAQKIDEALPELGRGTKSTWRESECVRWWSVQAKSCHVRGKYDQQDSLCDPWSCGERNNVQWWHETSALECPRPGSCCNVAQLLARECHDTEPGNFWNWTETAGAPRQRCAKNLRCPQVCATGRFLRGCSSV